MLERDRIERGVRLALDHTDELAVRLSGAEEGVGGGEGRIHAVGRGHQRVGSDQGGGADRLAVAQEHRHRLIARVLGAAGDRGGPATGACGAAGEGDGGQREAHAQPARKRGASAGGRGFAQTLRRAARLLSKSLGF